MTRIPVMPPNAPRNGGPAGRWLGRNLLRLGGWTIEGDWPDLPRIVVIVAPHSSAWDAYWGLAAKLAMGVDITFIGKAELFHGPLGWLLRKLGGHPVDRSAPGGIVDQTAAEIRDAERMWFVLAPEGTRRRVERWKPGFWRIARQAGVPVFCAGFDYPGRRIVLDQLFEPGDDYEADMAHIRALYRPHVGRNRDTL